MRPGVDALRTFYASRDGRRVAHVLAARIGPMLRRATNARLLGVGYPLPAIAGLDAGRIERIALAMQSAQGVEPWTSSGRGNAALAVDAELPFPGAAFDQAIACHALEFGDTHALLAELWRVLAPAGELIAVVANRASLWTHFERTPFGQGQPFGRNGLDALLAESGFETVERHTLLVAPPLPGLRRLDPLLTRIMPRLGGIHIVRARKSAGAALNPVGRVRAAPRPAGATAFAAPD